MQYDLSCKTWHFFSPITSFPRVISLLCHKNNTLSSNNMIENVHKKQKILSDFFFLFLYFFLRLNMNNTFRNRMVSDLFYYNIQVFPAAPELLSVLRYTFQNSADKAAESIIFFYRKLHIYDLCHIIQDRSSLYFPDMFSCLLNIIRLRQIFRR